MEDKTKTWYGCTKLQKFPYAVYGACDSYERVTLATTSLQCKECAGAFVAPLCKNQPDNCDSTAPALTKLADAPGVEVSVNGVKKCAEIGLISNCQDYLSISTDGTKTLGPCRVCDLTYAPAISVGNANICIPTSNVIANCDKYYLSANLAAIATNPYTCAICTSGLPYNTVKKICPSSAS